jgi:hypothetical protein
MTAPSRATLARLEQATAIGILLFWLGFFTVGLAPADPPPGYFAFEHAFPLPDVLLATALLVAAHALRGATPEARARGHVLSLVAAGGLLFLGTVDFSFNLQQGMYTRSLADGVMNALINAWCVVFGLLIVRRLGADS